MKNAFWTDDIVLEQTNVQSGTEKMPFGKGVTGEHSSCTGGSPRDPGFSAPYSFRAKGGVAVHLYAEGRLSIGKARELATMTLWEFRQLLASRRISPHFDEADLSEHVATLRELGRL